MEEFGRFICSNDQSLLRLSIKLFFFFFFNNVPVSLASTLIAIFQQTKQSRQDGNILVHWVAILE